MTLDRNQAHSVNRVVIEAVMPQVDCGRHAVCRVVGDSVVVSAVIFADGHDLLAARLLYRHGADLHWRHVRMAAGENDLWTGSFKVDRAGTWVFSVQGWVDHFATWAGDLKKRLGAQRASEEVQPAVVDSSEIPLALRTGAMLLREAARRAGGADAERLLAVAGELERLAGEQRALYEYELPEDVLELAALSPDVRLATRSVPELPVRVDRERARFSAWYELFPRSAAIEPGRHGSFRDVERQLPEIAAMGFDVLYFPPIHPIGRRFRKGPNNATTAGPEDLGSPWAVGDREAVRGDREHAADDGGHMSIHPELGSFAEFDHLVAAAAEHGLEIALDIAFQCSPDHPWVTDHPNWFVRRLDGSIQYAENPPKKYQDIYPLNFESPDRAALWDELYAVFAFWVERGVSIFRVDNPHTKALPFWEWCLGKLHRNYPQTIFLAEAFTRPHVMYALAKAGFTQSYTYFTWRTTGAELREYLEEITRPPVSEFFRPNFWPNTPDILHRQLQVGGRAAFVQRLILAATLTANYGIYGPAYELCESAAARPQAGKSESEEYLDSEKYEIRQRDRNGPGTLVPLITALNGIRRANAALASDGSLYFHGTDNAQLLCYSKATADFSNVILMVVCLDCEYAQSGWVDLELERLGLDAGQKYEVEDLLTGARYPWRGRRNYVALRPEGQAAHVFRVIREFAG